MAECNVDSRQFVGAVSRVIADVSGDPRTGRGRFSLIEIWPEMVAPPPRPMVYHVREQGAAPNSTIPVNIMTGELSANSAVMPSAATASAGTISRA